MSDNDTPAEHAGDETEENRIERLDRTVETLTQRVVELETERVSRGRGGSAVSRRSVLGALGLAGLAGLGATTASADPQGQIGTSSDPLRALNVEAINTGNASTDFELSVGGSRALLLGQEEQVQTLAGRVVLGHSDNSASGPAATISGGGRGGAPNRAGRNATVSGGNDNRATRNAATISGGFGNEASGRQTTISGGISHSATSLQATIGGGNANTASDDTATVGGGRDNTANGTAATVGGGRLNEVQGDFGTIAGGGPSDPQNNAQSTRNVVYDDYGTIAGGAENQVGTDDGDSTSAVAATVSGGEDNRATADYATVLGGQGNRATAPSAFAGGSNASADHEGAFVWSDTSDGGLASLNPDEFAVLASGGTFIFSNDGATTGVELTPGSGSWSSASSRALKSDIDPVSEEDVLDQVTDLEISRWSYDSQDGVRHMGPMAEEFHDAFGLGDDEEKISTVDADGVALAAIQGLAERQADAADEREATEERVETAHDRIADLEAENEALRDRLEAQGEEIAALREQLSSLQHTAVTDGRSPDSPDDGQTADSHTVEALPDE